MTGLAQRIFRRGASGPPSGRRLGIFGRSAGAGRQPWGKQATGAPPVVTEPQVDGPPPPKTSFRERGKLRRRLRFLRRARELAYRDIGGLLFDLRRFGRNRQDLLEAKLGALGAVDQELRTLERALGDRRAFHELREPGISSCPRCGALHASDANFCPHCGLQLGGPRVMGEVGGAIAAPPQAPPAPAGAPAPAAAGEPAPSQPTQTLRPPDAPDGA